VPIDTAASTQLPIRCFLSYARADDEEYGFILPLKKSLEHLCFSDGGRRLEVFVDRDAIGWGENWRDKIADSLGNAMVFIPVISLQFFDRPACRAELQAFHAAAKQLGVTDLLLPLVVFGRNQITSASDDALIRSVEELQHLDIQDAVLSGPGSPQWRATMLDVSRKLITAVEHAEKVIQDHDSAGTPPAETGDGELGLYELDARIEAATPELTTHLESLGRDLNAVAAIVNPHTQRMQGASQEVIRSVAADVARDIEETALDIQRAGVGLETVISAVDADIRRYHALVMEYGSDEMKASMRRELASLSDQFAEFRGVQGIMSDFIAQIQPVEVLSVPLRRSLRPLRIGVTSMQVALSIMESWTRLGD
jgi:hypothetical protein